MDPLRQAGEPTSWTASVGSVVTATETIASGLITFDPMRTAPTPGGGFAIMAYDQDGGADLTRTAAVPGVTGLSFASPSGFTRAEDASLSGNLIWNSGAASRLSLHTNPLDLAHSNGGLVLDQLVTDGGLADIDLGMSDAHGTVVAGLVGSATDDYAAYDARGIVPINIIAAPTLPADPLATSRWQLANYQLTLLHSLQYGADADKFSFGSDWIVETASDQLTTIPQPPMVPDNETATGTNTGEVSPAEALAAWTGPSSHAISQTARFDGGRPNAPDAPLTVSQPPHWTSTASQQGRAVNFDVATPTVVVEHDDGSPSTSDSPAASTTIPLRSGASLRLRSSDRHSTSSTLDGHGGPSRRQAATAIQVTHAHPADGVVSIGEAAVQVVVGSADSAAAAAAASPQATARDAALSDWPGDPLTVAPVDDHNRPASHWQIAVVLAASGWAVRSAVAPARETTVQQPPKQREKGLLRWPRDTRDQTGPS
ncbi:MAG: hypothetical protein CMJ58_19625 [Planctomycetaceae bacterium]|nr:hypothetical protein [Planctomycetaceae bacterium]